MEVAAEGEVVDTHNINALEGVEHPVEVLSSRKEDNETCLREEPSAGKRDESESQKEGHQVVNNGLTNINPTTNTSNPSPRRKRGKSVGMEGGRREREKKVPEESKNKAQD